jgi:hypothetical protein
VQRISGESNFTVGGQTFRIVGDETTHHRQEQSAETDADAVAMAVPEMEYAGPTVFTSKDGVLSITMPARPKATDKTEKNKDVTTGASCVFERGNVTYNAAVTEYADTTSLADADTILKRVQDQFGDKLIESKLIEVDGRKGVQLVRTQTVEGLKLVLTHRMFLFDGKMYQALVVCPESLLKKYDAKKYLETLHFKTAAKP